MSRLLTEELIKDTTYPTKDSIRVPTSSRWERGNYFPAASHAKRTTNEEGREMGGGGAQEVDTRSALEDFKNLEEINLHQTKGGGREIRVDVKKPKKEKSTLPEKKRKEGK